MANDYQSTKDSGLLKDVAEGDAVGEALKKKRKKLAETQIGLEDKDIKGE